MGSSSSTATRTQEFFATPPPAELLRFMGVADCQPSPVRCAQCAKEHPNHHHLLAVRYGDWLFYLDYKHKDKSTGQVSGVWIPTRVISCERGHIRLLCPDGKLRGVEAHSPAFSRLTYPRQSAGQATAASSSSSSTTA